LRSGFPASGDGKREVFGIAMEYIGPIQNIGILKFAADLAVLTLAKSGKFRTGSNLSKLNKLSAVKF
jgi:hypothetical protein